MHQEGKTCMDVTLTSFKLQNSFQTGRLIILCCQQKMINLCRKFMVPHHPGLTIKVFAKSGSTQCILLIKCFKRTKQDIGKTRDTQLKISTLSWRRGHETKKRTQTTHRITPLALPQHSSKGRVSGFAEQRKQQMIQKERDELEWQSLLLADASAKKLQLNMAMDFPQPSLNNPLLFPWEIIHNPISLGNKIRLSNLKIKCEE